MALPHKQMFCQNLAALWVRKQFLASRMKYLVVPLLPGVPGRECGEVETALQCESLVLSLASIMEHSRGYCMCMVG
ncbi:Uncharacterized protein HZ326_19566 [Fusarium oxysporum f. sp. albedinis]|nr:Uncharacterized protein HZ326_19566 [Fusarium oxysporum f. sp. albedinis]